MSVYIGIDWSESKHDVVFLNDDLKVVAYLTIPHTPEGFRKLDTTRQAMHIPATEVAVGLETAHNLLIDFLWARGYRQVYVLPPNVVKSSRRRYRQSGARTDESDAFVIANLLRTDRTRFQAWCPDSPLTCQTLAPPARAGVRAKVSWISYLTHQQVQLSNRLRAVLLRYYPAAAEVFGHLTSQIALEFICAFPTPQAAQALTSAQFKAFAKQQKYSRPRELPAGFARLQAPQPEAAPEVVQRYQDEAVHLAQLLLSVVREHSAAERELTKLFRQHPDFGVFDSLPGAGDFLAPALLTKFGDDRERFPTPGSVQALAGTCPVTAASGKKKIVHFRRACDREFRHLAQQWAMHSLSESVWANTYFEQVRPHCDSQSHAYRCLANRWLAIAWKLWQTHQPYDEAYHLQQRAKRHAPRD
jgi:transposase